MRRILIDNARRKHSQKQAFASAASLQAACGDRACPKLTPILAKSSVH